jgi:hypothetical protein
LRDTGSARAVAGSITRPRPLELDDPEIGAAGRALVAPAVLEHDVARAVGSFLEARHARERRRVLLVVDRVQEDVADRAVERVDALEEHDEVRARELAEQPRRDERELVARLELALELDLAPLGPRRQEQRKRDDRDEERRREPQDRLQQRGQRLARRHPHDHLAVAVPARQREQHGQEQRDREQDVQVEQGVEAEQRQDSVGRDRAAGRAGEQAQHEIGEQDRRQDDEQPDRRGGQLAHERAAKDHDAGNRFDFFGIFCRQWPEKALTAIM